LNVDLKVITIEESAFYDHIYTVVERVKGDGVVSAKWIHGEEAMRMLRITSKTTLPRFGLSVPADHLNHY
jgi:hypothetical protein